MKVARLNLFLVQAAQESIDPQKGRMLIKAEIEEKKQEMIMYCPYNRENFKFKLPF